MVSTAAQSPNRIGLVRPVWYLFDKIGEDRIEAVVFLGAGAVAGSAGACDDLA
jgi:hypothetical protein